MATQKSNKSSKNRKSYASNITTYEVNLMVPSKSPPAPSVEVAESICGKARRLAREDDEKQVGLEREKVSAIIGGQAPGKSADGTYEICGHRWKLSSDGWNNYLECTTKYNGLTIYRSSSACDPTSFGHSLIAADKQLALFMAEYPNTIWGNIKAWFARW